MAENRLSTLLTQTAREAGASLHGIPLLSSDLKVFHETISLNLSSLGIPIFFDNNITLDDYRGDYVVVSPVYLKDDLFGFGMAIFMTGESIASIIHLRPVNEMGVVYHAMKKEGAYKEYDNGIASVAIKFRKRHFFEIINFFRDIRMEKSDFGASNKHEITLRGGLAEIAALQRLGEEVGWLIRFSNPFEDASLTDAISGFQQTLKVTLSHESTEDVKPRRFPDFLIVGAARSGTTSLGKYLNQHPQIFVPAMSPRFFTSTDHRIKATSMIRNVDDYSALFENTPAGHVAGEKSISYLFDYEEAIRNIRRYVPEWKKIKILILLRNPVERVISHYRYFLQCNYEKNYDFYAALLEGVDYYLGYGLYYEQVKAYQREFPQVKIILFEDFRTNTLAVMQDIFRFLGVDDSYQPKIEIHNPTKVYGSPIWGSLVNTLSKPGLISSHIPFVAKLPLEKRARFVANIRKWSFAIGKKQTKDTKKDQKTKRYLLDYYREDILKLQKLIGKDLSNWLK